MADLFIRNVRVEGNEGLCDMAVINGVIDSIVPAGARTETVGQSIDGEGGLVLPPFVEPHIHLDATMTAGQPRWNESGTLFEGIARWAERKPSLTESDVIGRATQALKWMAAQGVLHVRTHVDVTDPDLTGLKALLTLREKVAPILKLQIVAFPQEGVFSFNKAQGRELLEEALRLGADVVGAIPHYEFTREYGVSSVDAAFELAAKYDRKVDIHCDEIDDEQSRFVEVVATRALETGMGAKVTASHTTAMHSYNGAYAYKLFNLLQRADINFISNPLVNLTLQGRFDDYPKRRGLTRVKELMNAGLNVSLGHDDLMDPWYSLGTGNMLQVAHMAIHAAQLTGRSEVMRTVDMVTTNSARTLQIESEYGVEVGKPANFNIIPADDKWDLMRRMPKCRYVISHGQVVAQTPTVPTTLAWDGSEERIDFRRNGGQGA